MLYDDSWKTTGANRPVAPHGIAVVDLQSSIDFYHDLFGLEPGPIIVREDIKVPGCFIPVGDTNLELLEGTGPESTISAHISQRGEGLHHICFEVGGIADKLKTLEALGIPLLDKVPRGSWEARSGSWSLRRREECS